MLSFVRVMNIELGFILFYFILYFIFIFIILDLDKECDVMSHVTVTKKLHQHSHMIMWQKRI